MILRPDYINRIKPFIGLEPVKVLTGLRRSGKSVMLKLIQDEIRHEGVAETNIISFNFESMNTPRDAEALHREIAERVSGITGKLFMFFDEIQEVQDWEKCINSLRVEYDCDIYITGSNAKLLSGELATYLAGRYVEFVIYPFSFKEFLNMPSQKAEAISSAFRKYIQLGGMPFLSNIADNPEACNLYLTDIYNSVILKDVVRRNNIRDVDQLERVITYVLANVGHSFSATSLSKYFKSEHRTVSHDTILNYTTCITLDATFDNGYDGIIPEIAQLERFFGSYTEWTHDRKLNVICRVEGSFKNVELSCSYMNRQLRHKWSSYFAPISGISYGTTTPIAELTGKVTYLHEILALLDKDYMNCLKLMNDNLHHFFRVAAKAFLQKCLNSSIVPHLEGNKIRLDAVHDCDERVVAFLNNLLDNSRYLQSAIILEYCYNCDAFWETLSNLYTRRLPCSPHDASLAVVFGLDKYQLYR